MIARQALPFVRQLVGQSRLSGSFMTKKHFTVNASRFLPATAQASQAVEAPILSPNDVDPKIRGIVDQISKLTLLEVSELNQYLKQTLKIPDAPVMAFAAGGASSAAAPKEEDEAEQKIVQTAFTLKITKFEDTKKVALIKEVKNVVEGLNLVQAKKFVESLPQVVKSNISKDEAEKLKVALESSGATCTID